MEGVVSPPDHRFPDAEEDVSVILSPEQSVVAPLAVTVGVAGVGLTVTTVAADAAEEQPPETTVTVGLAELLIVIDWVVSPVDHTLFAADDEVSTTFPPEQKVVGPPAVTVGVAGVAGSVRVCESVFEIQPDALVKVTV